MYIVHRTSYKYDVDYTMYDVDYTMYDVRLMYDVPRTCTMYLVHRNLYIGPCTSTSTLTSKGHYGVLRTLHRRCELHRTSYIVLLICTSYLVELELPCTSYSYDVLVRCTMYLVRCTRYVRTDVLIVAVHVHAVALALVLARSHAIDAPVSFFLTG